MINDKVDFQITCLPGRGTTPGLTPTTCAASTGTSPSLLPPPSATGT